jgi:DNA polymerase elongation subunit (family B)
VQRENPDIIIGYNIFSFDYEFMFRRSQELACVEDFLKLSRNNDELCATIDYKNPGKIDIDRSSTTLASGTYELAIIKMNGRLQVDMLNWFRRTENLTSYKLDYVGGHFIGDEVKSVLHRCRDEIDGLEVTRVMTNNMTGLQEESYVHFEEINHSSDYYKDGQKFKVIKVCKEEGWFEILGTEKPYAKKVKWGLAKDDVTPKDIFRMTNEGPASRAIIAKYCIQDCNLVHYLFNKVDVVTDLVEMSKLCSVPMSFLIFRGQGIKLTSYVAKKCREKGVLIPVINKGSKNDGYEGAIVLDPKCGLYLEEAVCVGDFASLYPSSMLSENLCPSSKVWTKTYDLAGNLIPVGPQFTCNPCANPVAHPTVTTTYVVQSDLLGTCISSDTITINKIYIVSDINKTSISLEDDKGRTWTFFINKEWDSTRIHRKYQYSKYFINIKEERRLKLKQIENV